MIALDVYYSMRAGSDFRRIVACLNQAAIDDAESCHPGMTESVSRCFPGMKRGRSSVIHKSLVSYKFFNEIGPGSVSRATLE